MGMSDQEYARVVGELKGTQAHKEDWADRMMRTNAEDFTRYIGSFADYAASDIEYAHIKNPALAPCDPATARATRARGKEIRARADAMGGRVRALSPSQVTMALSDTAHRLCMQFHRTRDARHPLESYTRALDDIERELQIAEGNPR